MQRATLAGVAGWVVCVTLVPWGMAQEASSPTVSGGEPYTLSAPPLPRHAERGPAAPADSRPPAALPQRGEPEESAEGRRSLPTPAQPARGLPEIGEEPPAEENIPSLLQFLPHRSRSGAVVAEYIYTAESFTLTRGGLSGRTPTNYRGNLDVVLTLDTELAGGWKGGRFFVYGQSLHGQPLSQSDVGDVQLFSNIDSTISDTERPQFTSVAEYWWEQAWLDGGLRTKVGKQDANADFAFCDLGGDFVHSSFGLPPTIPLPTFPSQALGLASFIELNEQFSIGMGVYDGTLPSGPQGVRWGFDTLGHNGAIFLEQLQFLGQTGPNDQLPNSLRVGLWQHTGDDVWTDFAADPHTFSSNGGVWVTADQMLFKEEYGSEDTQGLGGFVMTSWTQRDRNAISASLGAGLVYQGLIPRRDHDLLGAGVAVANFGQPYRDAELLLNGNVVGPRETATEVFYKCTLSPWCVWQPELQYISSPSGMFADALLVGNRWEVAF